MRLGSVWSLRRLSRDRPSPSQQARGHSGGRHLRKPHTFTARPWTHLPNATLPSGMRSISRWAPSFRAHTTSPSSCWRSPPCSRSRLSGRSSPMRPVALPAWAKRHQPYRSPDHRMRYRGAWLVCAWSGRKDSNLRPLEPHSSALPGCATPRLGSSLAACSREPRLSPASRRGLVCGYVPGPVL